MLTYYQTFLLPFLRTSRYTLPRDIARAYFISFEDALWNLLTGRGLPKKSVILVPDFYCMDVVENIKQHGYTPVFYPLDNHFQIKKTDFEKLRKKYSPAVIIFFHACGIQQKILNNYEYIQRLAQHTLIIEDAVQRLVNPEKIRILHPNHVIIDSLRKTSPLHGSFIYGNAGTIISIPHPIKPEYVYQLKTTILFVFFRLVFITGVLLKSNSIIRYAHKVILQAHDDTIGDSIVGHNGVWYVPLIHSYFNFPLVESLKKKQVIQYSHLLKDINKYNRHIYAIHIPEKDYSLLHVFPVGYHIRNTFTENTINSCLHRAGYPVWTKFPDCPWSKKRAVLFLPLGFHVEYNEIKDICSVITHI